MIALKSCLYQLRRRCSLIIHRYMTKKRFLPPGHEAGPQTTVLRQIEPSEIKLPYCYANLSRSYKKSGVVRFDSELAYQCSQPSGFVIHGGNFIEIGPDHLLDSGNQSKTRWKFLEQQYQEMDKVEYEHVIVPWGCGGASYGDFLIQFLPKLARLISSMPENAVNPNTAVCLPHFHHHPWAKQYLRLLGFRDNQILDGSKKIVLPPNGRIIIGTGPNFTNGIAHPTDIGELLKQIRPALPPLPSKPWRRLYISRKNGRIMENETDLLEGLISRDFEVIQLENFPVSDQIRLFQEATIIVGPHGAGHANIMWAPQTARLVEVFHPYWMHPSYAVLSAIRGIEYHCLIGHDGFCEGNWNSRSYFGISENPTIKPEVFFGKIDQIDSL